MSGDKRVKAAKRRREEFFDKVVDRAGQGGWKMSIWPAQKRRSARARSTNI